ncbi:hypothetical protein [Calothrix sp. NIES-2100]|uniref:hypothetical protein n=1 Tax=Calothrix sp. NIES-2100 TaxID=1954172 RepID=UPI0030DC24DF
MPSALRIILTAEEDRTLKELSCADQVPRRTKQRAIALRLNAHGWNVPYYRRVSRLGTTDSKGDD